MSDKELSWWPKQTGTQAKLCPIYRVLGFVSVPLWHQWQHEQHHWGYHHFKVVHFLILFFYVWESVSLILVIYLHLHCPGSWTKSCHSFVVATTRLWYSLKPFTKLRGPIWRRQCSLIIDRSLPTHRNPCPVDYFKMVEALRGKVHANSVISKYWSLSISKVLSQFMSISKQHDCGSNKARNQPLY
jgi:hypothetical protein